MKKVFFALIFIFFYFHGFSQCPEGYLSLTTQSEVDNFKINYPNCTSLPNDLSITGTDITNLQGLNEIVSIAQQLVISRTSLNNLSGLENLTSVGSNINIMYNSWLSSLSGLSSLVLIGNNLLIYRNNVLPNLNGLSSNITIGGYLDVSSNTALTALQLNGNYTVNGNLSINSNNSLTSISDLNNINNVHDLIIVGNDQLTSITGFSNLTSINGDLNIGNKLLTNLSGFRNLETVGGSFELYGNKNLENLTGFGGLKSVGVNKDDETYGYAFKISYNEKLKTLQEISSLERIEGSVLIQGNDLDNLIGPFVNVSEIGGSIYIYDTVKSLEGLENISKINDRIQIRDTEHLEDLTGLDGLQYIGGILYLHSNDALLNLNGLENLKEIIGGVQISSNVILESLSGLDNLLKIGSPEENNGVLFQIFDNQNLIDLIGLNKLKSVNGSFNISNNNKLENLNGLQALDSIGTVLNISNNAGLLDVTALNGIKSIGEQQEFNTTTTLVLSNNEKIVSYEGIEVEKLKGKISIIGNPSLKKIGGFEQLQLVDFIDILNNFLLEEIDGFNNLNRINENLEIKGNVELLNITGFSNLTEITQNLTLDYNLVIEDISGFENLQKVNTILISRNGFKTLNGLSKLNEVQDLEISENPKLESFLQFTGLSEVRQLGILDNDALTSVEGFENLESINQGYLFINNNELIQDLNGFNSLKKVGSGISIRSNPNLQSLNGIDSINEVTSNIDINGNSSLTDINAISNIFITGKNRTSFKIEFNRSLSVCDLPSLCNYIASGRYWYVGYNAGDCNQTSLNNSCSSLYNKISGVTKYTESNLNCETTNFTLPNVKITANNGISEFTSFSDENGVYSIHVKEGTNTFTAQPDKALFTSTPSQGSYNFTQLGQELVYDYCITPTPNLINDISLVLIPLNNPRPGFNSSYHLVYQNNGNTNTSGEITLEFDNTKATLLNSSEIPVTETTNLIEWNFTDLSPYEKRTIQLDFNIAPPPVANINEILKFENSITSLQADSKPEDNTFTLNQTLIGSYDPNDKTVLEGENVSIDNVGDYLNYVIRFQNTGTASAINVKIKDELSENLDWNTFSPVSSSHPNNILITDGNNVEFIFDDINLPDSNSDESGSNGYVAFKIKPKPGLAIGDIISGNASIYFDFNPPIITNTVHTEIVNLDIDGDGVLNDDDNCPETANPSQEDLNNNGIGDICEVDQMVVEATQTNAISCYGNDGKIITEVQGGALPYNFELFDDSSNLLITSNTTGVFENLALGTYHIIVTDSDLSVATSNSVQMTEASPLTIITNVNDISCYGANDGSITIHPTDGIGPYEYSIDYGLSFQSYNSFVNLTSGTYLIIARDINGCEINDSVIITEPLILTEDIVVTNASTTSSNDGLISIMVEGGTAPYSYSLENGGFEPTSVFTNLPEGDYDLSIRDSNGCLSNITVVVGAENTAIENTTQTICTDNIILASDSMPTELFGKKMSVSADGNTVAVSAYYDNEIGEKSGSVYIFEKQTDGSLLEIQKLTASNVMADLEFGFSIAFSATDLIVSSYKEDNTAGTVYVFEQTINDTWVEKQKIVPSDKDLYQQFGYSLASDGDYFIVGSPNDSDLGTWSGSAYIFEKGANGLWVELQKLTASDGAEKDSFGISVAISGANIVVGADKNDDNGESSGSAYIFEKDNNNSWSQTTKLIPNDGATSDFFGTSVAISKTWVVVGSRFQDTNGLDSGAAYIFEKLSPGIWSQPEKLLAFDGTENDGFAHRVAINDTYLAISAPLDDDIGTNTGSVHLYEFGSNYTWDFLIKLNACNATPYRNFGDDLSLSGSTLGVGTYYYSKEGIAYAFEIDGAILDTDGDGVVDNQDEDPNDPCLPLQAEGYINYELHNEIWANGDCDLDGIINGEEVINGTDPYLADLPELNLVLKNASCGHNGEIVATAFNGEAPFTYQIMKTSDNIVITSNSSGEFIRLQNTEYLIIATDANSISVEQTATLIGPDPIYLDQVVTPTSGPNASDGSIELLVTGGTMPYYYHVSKSEGSWGNTGAEMSSENYYDGLSAGSYTIYVYDSNNCGFLVYAVVIDPPVFQSTTSIVDYSCELGTYILETEVENGTAPFNFELLDSENNIISTSSTGLFSNVTSGNYKVKITDAENLISEGDIINLTQHVSLEAISQLYDTECANENMPSLGIVVNGGLPPYSYSLDGGLYTTDPLFINLEQGEHTYTVLDSNGCTTSEIFVLDCDSEPTELSVNAQIDAVSCDNKSTIVALVDGGAAPYSYELFNAIYNSSIVINSTGIFDNLEMGSYFVTVKDVNNFSVQSNNIQTTEITPLNATTTINQISCIGQKDGSIEVNVEGGSGSYEFSIDQGTTFQTNNLFESLSEGNYEISIHDSSGCSLIIPAELASNELCSDFTLAADNFTIESTGESCTSSNNGTILIRANESAEYRANLSNGVVTETKSFRTFSNFQNLEAGTYELCVVVVDQLNYKKCFTVNITEPETLEVGTDIDESGKSISLSLKGGARYYITLNDTEYSTSENEITLPLSKMSNDIKVKTDIDCQGVFENTFLTTYESVTIYPNPVEQGDVTILLPDDSAPEVLLTLFTQSGIRVREKLEKILNRTAKLNMDGLAPGVYTIIVTTENQNSMRQIIKK
ncbi:DUF7619 domain-containing protein [Maribacter spongiicola]|uniref:DUF7619 domain-containing protein n=1 Tax=Maribacter spongiicola TaxID=1206753 RepID=UPI003F949967